MRYIFDLLKDDIELIQIDNQTYSIISDNFKAEIVGIETIYFGDGSSILL